MRKQYLLLIPLLALLALFGVPATGLHAETLPPMNVVSIPQLMPPADGLDGTCDFLVSLGVYKDRAKCIAELNAIKLPNLLIKGTVPAGRDFYAGSVKVRSDNWFYLDKPTNFDQCPTDQVDFRLEYEPTANMSAQWPHCTQLNVQGGPAQFKFMSRLAKPGQKLSWLVTAEGGAYSTDLGITWKPFKLAANVIEIPQTGYNEVWVKTTDANSFFTAELKKGTLTPTGAFELKAVPGVANWMRLMKGATSADFCAHSIQWQVLTADGVNIDFPECVKLVANGTGKLTLKIRGDPVGYNSADMFGYGAALWQMGSGKWRVLDSAGVEVCTGSLDKGSSGIMVRPDKEFTLEVNVDDHLELPFGEVRRDTVNNVIVAPTCDPSK